MAIKAEELQPNQHLTQLKQRRRRPSTHPDVLSGHAGAWQQFEHHGKEHGGNAPGQRGVAHLDQRLAGGQLALGPVAKGAQAGAGDQRVRQQKFQSQKSIPGTAGARAAASQNRLNGSGLVPVKCGSRPITTRQTRWSHQ